MQWTKLLYFVSQYIAQRKNVHYRVQFWTDLSVISHTKHSLTEHTQVEKFTFCQLET